MSPGGTTRRTSLARPVSTLRWSRPTPSTSTTSLPAHGCTVDGRGKPGASWAMSIGAALLPLTHSRTVVRALAARQAAVPAGSYHVPDGHQHLEELRRMASEEGRDGEEVVPSRSRKTLI